MTGLLPIDGTGLVLLVVFVGVYVAQQRRHRRMERAKPPGCWPLPTGRAEARERWPWHESWRYHERRPHC